MHYDYLIVGAGLYGAVFANEAAKKGKKCLVVEKRDHLAGNIYTKEMDGINVHVYGAHIFHTSDKFIWEYINEFAEFNNYVNSPIARYKDELYNLPFNMNTFSRMWGITTPAEAKDIIAGVTCFDILKKEKTAFKTPECRYGYRESIFKTPEFKERYIITGVLFRLSREAAPKTEYGALKSVFEGAAPTDPMQVREAVIKIREAKLPSVEIVGTAGSFFKNPVVSPLQFTKISEGYENVPHYIQTGGFIKVPAAWMIEQCGLKGASVGGAQVYEKQPLVIINKDDKATPQDVLALEKKVIDEVKNRFGVELTPEVEHI